MNHACCLHCSPWKWFLCFCALVLVLFLLQITWLDLHKDSWLITFKMKYSILMVIPHPGRLVTTARAYSPVLPTQAIFCLLFYSLNKSNMLTYCSLWHYWWLLLPFTMGTTMLLYITSNHFQYKISHLRCISDSSVCH